MSGQGIPQPPPPPPPVPMPGPIPGLPGGMAGFVNVPQSAGPVDPIIAQFRQMQMESSANSGTYRAMQSNAGPRTNGGPQVPTMNGNTAQRQREVGMASQSSTMPAREHSSRPAIVPTIYEGWTLQKSKPEAGEKPTWARIEKTQMVFPSEELEGRIKRKRAKNKDFLNAEFKTLSDNQRRQVDRLVQDKMFLETNPDVEWKVACVDTEVRKVHPFLSVTECTKVHVILKRSMKPTIIDHRTNQRMSSNGGYIVDLSSPLPQRDAASSSGFTQDYDSFRAPVRNQHQTNPTMASQAPAAGRHTQDPMQQQYPVERQHVQGHGPTQINAQPQAQRAFNQGVQPPPPPPPVFPNHPGQIPPPPSGQPPSARPIVQQQFQPTPMPQQGRPGPSGAPKQPKVSVVQGDEGGQLFDDPIVAEFTEQKKKKKTVKKNVEAMEEVQPTKPKKASKRASFHENMAPVMDGFAPPPPKAPKPPQQQMPNLQRKSSLRNIPIPGAAPSRKAQEKVRAWFEDSTDSDDAGRPGSSSFSDTGNSAFTPPSTPPSDFPSPRMVPRGHRTHTSKQPFQGSLHNRDPADLEDRHRGPYREHRRPAPYDASAYLGNDPIPADVYIGRSHHRRSRDHGDYHHRRIMPRFSSSPPPPPLPRSSSMRDHSRFRRSSRERERDRLMLQDADRYDDYRSPTPYRDSVRHVRRPSPPPRAYEYEREKAWMAEQEAERMERFMKARRGEPRMGWEDDYYRYRH